MIIKVLASGSKGNSTLIQTKNANILIDVGLSTKELEIRLGNIKLDSIDAILITHTHTDHIKGLQIISKRYNIPVYTIENICNEQVIKDIHITAFNLSHDTPCIGFIIENNNQELVYITDTGYINRKLIPITTNKDVYIIESNHDEKMLWEGTYPYILKQRISDDYGHLSNAAASKYIKKVKGDKTKCVILAHLSEENNLPDVAYENMKKVLKDTDIELLVAKQYEVLDDVKV